MVMTKLTSITDAVSLIDRAWPSIVDECRVVLGGELHYQAMIYHCLRKAGGPLEQIGMNVKQYIADPRSEHFKSLAMKRHNDYGGCEPIPDIALFRETVANDWRRRQRARTLQSILMAIEVKASERAGSRLSTREIMLDIRKLEAHREEVAHYGNSMAAAVLIVDTAPDERERMRPSERESCESYSRSVNVGWMYLSPNEQTLSLPGPAADAVT